MPTREDFRLIPDANCLACGCLCDDVMLHVAAGRIAQAERACPLGERWFLAERPVDRPACLIDGRPANSEAGCERAAQLLAAAKSPLVFGLGGATCEAQRVAVAIADRLGACIETGNDSSAALAAAVQSVGMVTATLGEVRHRADLVIFWGVDPATTHLRHYERYSLTCTGRFVPRGRADRTCVVVDSRRTITAESADVLLQIEPGGDHAALKLLQTITDGADDLDGDDVLRDTGVALDEWRELLNRMQTARYGALFYDPSSCSIATLTSLLALVREMNRHTRFVALPLGSPGNMAGAEQVLSWQTGSPSAVNFAGGYPQYDPEKFSAAAMLASGKVDAALIVACNSFIDPLAALPQAARDHLAAIPNIVLHDADVPPSTTAAVAFTVATPGIHSRGTMFRVDGVPLPLRPAIASPYPSTETVLQSIQHSLQRAEGEVADR